jgi:outer membrane protein insertion porin family
MGIYCFNRGPSRAALPLVLALLAGATAWSAQSPASRSDPPPNRRLIGIIQQIEFSGLRRISAATLRAHIHSREGQPLDPAVIESDVRALDRLNWFDSVRVALEERPVLLADLRLGDASSDAPALEPMFRLIFMLEERPFLAGVEFRGSRALSDERIRALLPQRGITLKEAVPVNRTDVWRASRAIEAALGDLGYPQAAVRVRYREVPTAAARAIFEVQDGPHITVARVNFKGNRIFSDRKLRKQMKRVAPGARLAGLRGKDIYTPARLEEDLERVGEYYRNHGYPEARVGRPEVETIETRVRHWLPVPRRRAATRFHISVPVQEGQVYRLGDVRVRSEMTGEDFDSRSAEALVLRRLKPAEPYSQEEVERARETLAHRRARASGKAGTAAPEVDAIPQLEPETRTVRVTFRVREAHPYIVRRIEFLGAKRFNDRYYRRRILLKESEPFDPNKLELGLAQIARAGFIRPPKKEDVRVRFDEARYMVDVTIRVEEVGRQRISLVGGHGPLGSTIGLAYNVFDLFGGEELITAHIEGGPQSLQMLLGVAKDGLFGTRASLGLSLFHNVIQPNLPGPSGRGRLFTSRSSGFGAGWTYPLASSDTLGLNYQLSDTSTTYNLALPPALAGIVSNSLRTSTSSRSLGLTESHEGERNRWDASASVSGGWLGGNENLLRSSLQYARFQPDPLSRRRNSWAFRGYLSGVSSYRGDLPLSSRLFAGDELVRGFRPGELSPYALVSPASAPGVSVFRAQAVGADLAGAVNAEYRMPLAHQNASGRAPRAELAGFFDTGSGWLLPGWLGPNRPALLEGTNGALRASTGVELRLRLPVVEQTVRVHYSMNPLRLAEAFALPDGSKFRPPDRRAAFGWALGNFF